MNNFIQFGATDFSINLIRKRESYQWSVYNALNRYQSQWSKVKKVENPSTKDEKDAPGSPTTSQQDSQTESNNKYNSDEDDTVNNKWKLELAWLTKAIDPAMQLFKWPLSTGLCLCVCVFVFCHHCYGSFAVYQNLQLLIPFLFTGGNNVQPGSRSLAEILASIQKSKLGVQNWSLSDLTIGLYLVYLQQASKNPFEDVKGVKISNDTVVITGTLQFT